MTVGLNDEIVWLLEDRTFAFLVNMGAYYSIINRTGQAGNEELIENKEFELWSERSIEYESE